MEPWAGDWKPSLLVEVVQDVYPKEASGERAFHCLHLLEKIHMKGCNFCCVVLVGPMVELVSAVETTGRLVSS